MTITNTSKQDHRLTLMGSLSGCRSASARIEDMEAEGQRELVAGNQLPVTIVNGTEAQLETMGIKLGPVCEDDPLFRTVTLPKGWKFEATDHSMWSKLLDEKGRERISIFYKAAFYDRGAHIVLRCRFGIEGDYDATDVARCFVTDLGKRIHTVELPFTDDHYDDNKRARAQCKAWLDENWPGSDDPTKHWD